MEFRKIGSRIAGTPGAVGNGLALSILVIIGMSHFLNDMIQSVVPAIYPILKEKYQFSFSQIGLITLVFQMTSSLLQPVTGFYADKHPRPYSLSAGMCFTLAGLLIIAFAGNFALILLSVGVIGFGSSIFHPEASRVAQMASGGRKSFAQSIFQVGGNGGSAVGPLLAAAVVLPLGQSAIAWFALAAVLASCIMLRVGAWYKAKIAYIAEHPAARVAPPPGLSRRRIMVSMGILVLLIFSKYFYTACITSYFTFFLIDKFGVSVQVSQLCLFAFLAAFAIGTVVGGLCGDRWGRKYVIWFSILGAAPFSLAMPHLGLVATVVCAFFAGLIIASAFSSIVVYATDLMPDKVGLVAGVFFGLMFGLGGIGSAFFGWLADHTSIGFIFEVSAWLPLLGIIAAFLPDTRRK